MPDPILGPFERLARRDAHRPLVCAARASATVGDVDALARGLARRLAELRLPPDAVIGLAVPDGPGFLAAVVACRRAAVVPVLLDAWSPPAERRRIVGALGACLTASCDTGWPEGPADWRLEGAGQGVARGAGEHGSEPVVLPGAALVKLTSGSTGSPRGVVTPAAALAADDDQLFATMGLSDEDRLLSAVPLGHSYGLSSLALPALRRGVPLILPEPGSPFAPLEIAARFGATFFPTTPAWLHGLLRVAEPPRWPASLRLTISAGAPLSAETAARFSATFGRRVHTFYGSSECGGICFDRDGEAAARGTVGAPVERVRVELRSVDGGDAESAGQGIVTVRSPAVASGYTPAADARLADARLADGVFVSGDLGAWHGGEVALLGRVDDLLNVHGKKVSPREVERVLLELPAVLDAVVVGVAQNETGGHVVRAIVACAEGALTPADVLAHCRARLTRHKVPRSVLLLPEIPRTARGKIDRAALGALESSA